MDATQQIDNPFSDEEEEQEEDEKGGPEREQLATLKVFKNDHIPETEFPLYIGENVIGRDPAACSVLLPTRSVSSRHAVISISVFRSSNDRFGNGDGVEALLWDMGSLNGTRKGRFKLTPQVRYALTEGESVVLADVPCQYTGLKISKKDTCITPEKEGVSKKEKKLSPALSSSDSESELSKGVRNKLNVKERSVLPPVPLWSSEDEAPKMSSPQSAHKQSEITLVPESDSDGESAPDERKNFVSDSASSSQLCSSTNSSFLTPAKKVIPESEDESSITPSSASIDRFRLSQTPDEPCSKSSKPGPLALNLDSDVDFEEKDMEISKPEAEAQPELAAKVEPVSSAEFHMDSDTDVEEEEPETSKAEPQAQEAVTLEKPMSSVGLHMETDTDVEEEKNKTETEAQIEQAPKVGPASSADLHMDSDTDVEEEEPEVGKAQPQAQEAITLDKSVSLVGLHMDSDTDVEEAEEEKSKTEPKVQTQETPKVKSDLHMDSDSDVEENEASITENVSKKEAVTESRPSAAPPRTEFHMDSDTDVEDDNPMKVPFATEVSPPIGEGSDVRPTSAPGTELHMDSDTDVDEENEDKEKVKAKGLLSNSETDDEDPFKPLPGKSVKAAQGLKSHKVSVGSKAEQPEESTHKKQDHHSQAKTNLEEPTQAFGHLEDDWDLLPTQAYGTAGTSARFKPKQFDLEATQAYGTETDMEEEPEPLNHTQPYSNLSTAETQLIPVAKPDDDEEEEDKKTQNDSHLSTADTLILASTPKREEQTQPFSLFTAQTQLVWGEEDKEVYQNEPTQLMTDTTEETEEGEEENMKRGRRTCGGGTVHIGKNTSSCFIIAETQPMCEEEEATDADLSGDGFQKPSSRQQAEKYDSAHLAENHTIAETQPMCDHDEAPDQDKVVSSSHIEKPSSSYITIAETQPMFEEDEAPEEDLNNEVSRRQTKGEPVHQIEKASTSNRAIPETQSVGEDDEGQEKELSSKISNRRSRRCRPKKEKEVPRPAEAVIDHTITETQPMCEEEQTEDLKSEVRSGRQSKRQQSHELKSPELAETDLKACVTVAETQPMCEVEAPCEDLINAVSTRQIDEDRSTELPIPSSSHVSVDETQPMHEDDEGQEKDLSSKMVSRSSRRGRPKKDNEVTQTAEAAVHRTITETQPVPEEVIERDEDLNSGVKSRRSRRGRQIKEDNVPQPAEAAVSSISINTETQPVHEDRAERNEDLSGIRSKRPRRGRQKDEGEPAQSAEPNSDLSGIETQPMVEENAQKEPSVRSSRRQRKDKTEVEENTQEEPSARSSRRQKKEKTELESETTVSSKVQGKTRKGQEGKRKRGKVLSEDEEESEEEKTTRRGTRRTGMKLKCSEKEEEEKLEERNAQEERERMEKELQEQEETERLEMEEKERLEHERKKQEEREQRKRAETEMRQKLEREQKELEEKEQLKREEQKMRKEKERILQEKEKKDRLEKEEKERLERERRELEEKRRKEEERIQREKERLEKEEKEKLERERRELEEQRRKEEERIQREKEEKERLEKEEKERLERERRELEEKRQKEEEERIQKEKEQKEKERLEAEREQVEKERRENEELQMRAREQKKTKERNQQKQKNEEDKTELEASLVPPARRTRRCSSSSMNSDQSVSSQQVSSQRGQGRGRGRGRGKQTADEQPISARQSSRRGAAGAVEDTEQDSNSTTRSRSRSSSRSSERSAHSIGPSNQGTRGRGRGRKSMKLPEPEEVSQAKTSGKGRARGGRRSGVENVTVGMDNECEQDAEVVEDNTAVPQTNSRGRKRAANASTSPEEAPSPTPKTPRRSVASHAHKVLFTGLTDEDGERVVSRLGGSLAKGVNDMTHLVTDKARRTVKFLCAVARGVLIVTPDWLKKCGKAGHFLSTDEYILKDTEQEKKFNFSLQTSLQTAQTQPLLKGYEIHVTPSVMPEPSQMKEIITCCGARFLPKMPSAHKEHTVVVSCEQDRALCVKAVSMSLPVVSTEFLLTGILQQRVDLQAYSLTSSLNMSNQPAAPKAAARGRRK